MFKKYKKIFMAGGVIIAACLFTIYLWATFRPGLWHGDAFLYRQENGSFIGSDAYADYKMTIIPKEYGTDIDFSLNDKEFYYQLKYDGKGKAQVLQNGEVIFDGNAFISGDEWILLDENEDFSDIIISHGGNPPTEEELLPTRTCLYNWAVAEEYELRGTPAMMLLILILAVVLFLDIKFPQLFWFIQHGLDTTGGEPSDFYYFGQKVGRIVMVVGILACVIMTFTVH